MSGQCKGSLDQLFDLFLAARNQEDALSIFQEIKLQVRNKGTTGTFIEGAFWEFWSLYN